MTDICVIIANWNGKKYLKDCLNSLAGQTYSDFKIIFVDNGSEDGSVDFLRENYAKDFFSGCLEIISLEKNTGFAKGYNLGIQKALGDEGVKYILVLNNDTKLAENCLMELANCAKKNPQAGSIQAKVLNFFEKGRIDCAGIILAKDGTAHNRGYQKKSEEYNQEEEIFGANGTASLFSRAALEKTKISPGEYFDNSFFAYYEDVDLAWRLRLAGFESLFCPKAEVFHVHSATTGKYSLFKAYYLHRNYFFTVFKNYPFGIIMKTIARRFQSYARLVFGFCQKGKKENGYAKDYGKGELFKAILGAWMSVIANMPQIFRKRKNIRKKIKVSSKEINSWINEYCTEKKCQK